MARLTTNKRAFTTILAVLTLLLGAGLYYAVAQQMEEAKRDRAVLVGGAKYHVLPATLETTQWGWLDPKEPPKLVVNSGDVVAIETMMYPQVHLHEEVVAGCSSSARSCSSEPPAPPGPVAPSR